MPPSDPGIALQTAIVAAVSANAAIVALTGGEPRVYDDVPPRAPYPYITFGQTLERDWSAGSDAGSEHTVTLHVWSRSHGRREAAQIAAAIRTALHDQPLAVEGHRLVNLRHEFTETRRDGDGETYRALVRLRAATEPA